VRRYGVAADADCVKSGKSAGVAGLQQVNRTSMSPSPEVTGTDSRRNDEIVDVVEHCSRTDLATGLGDQVQSLECATAGPVMLRDMVAEMIAAKIAVDSRHLVLEHLQGKLKPGLETRTI
jgi:hypothetical protein